jgi:flagellar hook-length control protein FliK
MAQLTMHRHNPFAYEGRVSIPQASEAKPSSYKASKNEQTDHFQKNISEQNEIETDTKKISDRGLKRRQDTNEAKYDHLTNKKKKPLQTENQIQGSKDSTETMMLPVQDEQIQETLSLVLPSEEADLFANHEAVEASFVPQEPESITTKRLIKQKLHNDLASIASLDEPQITSSQETVNTEQSFQLVQADSSPDLLQNIDEPKEESSSPQITNSLLSAAQIEDAIQISPEQTSDKEPAKEQTQPAMLFPTQKLSDTDDLKDISELKTDDTAPVKEAPKRKKSKEVNEPNPKQLSFAFIEKPVQEFEFVNETPALPQKLEIKTDSEPLNLQQDTVTQNESTDAEKPGQVALPKNMPLSSETTVNPSSNDKPLEAFGMIANTPLSTTGSLTDLTSPAPSIMLAPNQTAPEQVAVKLITALNNGDDQINIRLTPEDLGEITIKLNISDNRVNALIQSDNAETLKLLQKDSQTLENALKDSGFTLESHNMEFSFTGGSSRQDQQMLQNEFTQNNPSLLNDDMLTSLTELTASDAQGRDYILTPTKVDIHI